MQSAALTWVLPAKVNRKPGEHIPANTMALNAALKQLIETKLAHTRAPQWALPITEVRQAFRNLWTPAITGELVPRRAATITLGVSSFPRRRRLPAARALLRHVLRGHDRGQCTFTIRGAGLTPPTAMLELTSTTVNLDRYEDSAETKRQIPSQIDLHTSTIRVLI